MFKAQVTQFMRPNGRPKEATVWLPGNVRAQYEAMQAAGGRLTAEVLTTGEVSQTIEAPECGDFAIKVTRDRRPVAEALWRLLRDFDVEKFETFVAEMA